MSNAEKIDAGRQTDEGGAALRSSPVAAMSSEAVADGNDPSRDGGTAVALGGAARAGAVDSAEMRSQVESVIEIIRPALQADGGDISLIEVDAGDGVVRVELHGACVSCPASTVTMKAGVERILKDRVPGVQRVVQVEEGLDGGLEDGTFVSF